MTAPRRAAVTARELALHRIALLESALHYARRAWPVFPVYWIEDGRCACREDDCASPGKHPLTPKGLLDATTDATAIRRWWTVWPDANVAIVTGAPTFVALDVDPEKGGAASLEALLVQHGPLPPTVEACTGGGGRHLCFQHPGGRIPNSTSTLGPGLDIRGDGGYIVAAPSSHRSGRAYEWELSSHPDDVPLAPMPAWLLGRLTAATSGHRARPAAEPITEIIQHGARNATLASLAGSMRRRGMTAAEIVDALRAVNQRRCVPPLKDDELQEIADSIGRYAPVAPPVADASPPDSSASRLTVVTWAELTQGEIEPIAYFWDGWISVAAVALLSAPGESLKSWLAAYLACSAASGRPAFAEPGTDEGPLRHGPVLYLAGENALAEERRRCQLLKAGLELPDDLPITFVDAGGLSLSDEADYRAVVALVTQLRPVLIVLDSAIALSGLPRENDNSDVRAFMKRRILPLARAYGATVLLIGHSPKAPTQPGVAFGDEHVARGAGEWRNSSDVLLSLKRDRSLGEFAVVLKHAKQRIGPRHAPIWFELQEPDRGRAVRLVYGGRVSEAAQGLQAGVRKAVALLGGLLKSAPAGLLQRDLREQTLAAGISVATYRRALGVLRGKTPWPPGPLHGKIQPVVIELRHGKHIHVTLDLTAWPAEEDADDA